MTKIAIICTSASMMGDKPTGAWLEEVATPYYLFKEKGFDVTIVSIKGGEIPVDQASMSGDFFTPDCKKFVEDEAAQAAMKASEPLGVVSTDAFDGIYLAGGHGTCVDFYDNPDLAKVIEAFYAANKAIAADCHGPIALLKCKKPDGTPLVAGLTMTGFTDTEEAAVGLTNAVPALVESEAVKLGAKFTKESDWSSCAAVDGKVVTGQNPASSHACAAKFVEVVLSA